MVSPLLINPMTQIQHDRWLSLSLLAKNWAENKEQSKERSAQFSASCRRSESLSSVAPILRTSAFSLPCVFSTLAKGDISTLQNRGHFYFALTWLKQKANKLPLSKNIPQFLKNFD